MTKRKRLARGAPLPSAAEARFYRTRRPRPGKFKKDGSEDPRDRSEWGDKWRAMLAKGWL